MFTRTNSAGTAMSLAFCVFLWAAAANAGAPGICFDPGTRDGYVCQPCTCSGDREVAAKGGKCSHCGMDLVARKNLKYVAIVLYDGVELLDFSGPAEVFAASRQFYVYTMSKDGKPVTSQGFVRLDPEYALENCPWPDVLVVPGGGARALTDDPRMLEWIGVVGRKSEYVLSVCSGAFVLAKAGMLDGLQATAHSADVNELRRAAPRTTVHADTRFVDNGKVITTAGVSAGIDGALHIVAKRCGDAAARKTAEYMEYDKWEPNAGLVVSQKSKSAP